MTAWCIFWGRTNALDPWIMSHCSSLPGCILHFSELCLHISFARAQQARVSLGKKKKFPKLTLVYLFLKKNPKNNKLCDSSKSLQVFWIRPKAYMLLVFPQYFFPELFKHFFFLQKEHRLDQNRSVSCHFLGKSLSFLLKQL